MADGTIKIGIEVEDKGFEAQTKSAATKAGKSAGAALETEVSAGASKGADKAAQAVDAKVSTAGKSAGKAAGDGLESGIKDGAEKGAASATAKVQSFSSAAKTAFGSIGSAAASVSNRAQSEINFVKAGLAPIGTAITGIFKTAATSAWDAFDSITGGRASACANAIATKMQSGLNSVKTTFIAAASTAAEAFNNQVVTRVSAVGSAVTSKVQAGLSGVQSVFSSVAERAGAAFQTPIVQRAASAISSFKSTVNAGLAPLKERFSSSGGESGGWFLSSLKAKLSGMGAGLKSTASGAVSGLKDVFAKAGEAGGSGMGSSLAQSFSAKAGAIMGIASTIAQSALSAITSSIDSAVKRVDTLNNFPKVLQNLGYSAEDATAATDKLKDKLSALPTTLQDAATGVQRLATSSSSVDQATNRFLAFNDALLAGGASEDQQQYAMEQLIKTMSTGKVEADGWMSITTAMSGQMDQLAKHMLGADASADDLYSAMQDGTVTTQQFADAMVDLDQNGGEGIRSFSDQAIDAVGGIGTSFTNMLNKIPQGMANIMAEFAPEITDTLGKVSDGIKAGFAELLQYVDPVKERINAFVHSLQSIEAQTGAFSGLLAAVQSLAPAASGLFDMFLELLPTVLATWAQVQTQVVAGIGIVLGIIQQVATVAQPLIEFLIANLPLITPFVIGAVAAWTTMSTILGVVEAAQAALNLVMSLNPIGVVVIAIAALVAGLLVLYNTNETVRNAIDAAWQMLQGAAAAVWPTIQNAITTVMETVQSVVSTVWPVVQALFSQGCAAVQGFIQAAWPVLQSIITTVMSAIQAAISVAWPIIQTIFTTAMNAIQAVIQTVWPIIKTVISSTLAVIQAVIQTVSAAIKGNWQGVWQGIQSILSTVWNGMRSIVSSVFNSISGTISGVLGGIKSTWSSAWSTVSGALSNAWGGMQHAAQSGINGIRAVVSGIKGTITGVFSGAGSWLVNSGKAMLNGLKRGIENGISGAVNAVKSGLSRIRSFFPFSPAKRGPFSGHGYTTYSGKALMQGFGQGIGAATEDAAAQAAAALADVKAAFGGVAVDAGGFDLTPVGATVNRVQVQAAQQQAAATTVNQTVNFNQPVSSPDEVARTMRLQQSYGLAGQYA